MVPYVVGAVVTMTVMHVLLFCVACVFSAKLLVCEGDGSAGVGFGEVWLR